MDSEIFYSCHPGFVPDEEKTATCTREGVWFPDPSHLECKRKSLLLFSSDSLYYIYLGDCGDPSSDSVTLVHINTTTEGSTITFICNETKGLPPNITLLVCAECKEDGKWSPDPSMFMCDISSKPQGTVTLNYLNLRFDKYCNFPAVGSKNLTAVSLIITAILVSVFFYISGILSGAGISKYVQSQSKCSRCSESQDNSRSLNSVYEDVMLARASTQPGSVDVLLQDNVAYGPIT